MTSPGVRSGRRSFYGRLAPLYANLIEPTEVHPRMVGLRLLAPRPGETVLDVGCGAGAALLQIAEAVGPTGRAIGLDRAVAMVDIARRRIRRKGSSAEAVVGEATRLAIEDATVDAIYAAFVIESMCPDDAAATLRECRRVLRPSGRIVLVSVSTQRSTSFVSRLYAFLGRHLPAIVDCRSIDGNALLAAAGFDVRERLKLSTWGLPVDAVLAEFAPA